jgi:nuclear pore complex protein Nup155
MSTHGSHVLTSTACHLIVEKKYLSLPREIASQYDRLECRSFLGLFPELQRAWISIDNRLFFWDYERNEHALVHELPHVITAVGLVKPAPDVFIDEVKYLLVIATAGHVYLDCVKVKQPGPTLVFTDAGFSVPADGASFRIIVGTGEGRILMGGEDGHIHELCYQTPRDLWSTITSVAATGSTQSNHRRKIHKTNHTRSFIQKIAPSFLMNALSMVSRNSYVEDPVVSLSLAEELNWLYVLHESDTIRVVDLSQGGFQISNAYLLGETIARTVEVMCGANNQQARFSKLVSIHPIPVSDSRNIRLVAVTSRSARLYISIRKDTAGIPYSMNIEYIRLAPNRDILQSKGQPSKQSLEYALGSNSPGFSSSGMVQGSAASVSGPISYETHTAFYSKGVLLSANAASEIADALLCTAIEPAVLQQRNLTLTSAARRTNTVSGGFREFPPERAHLLLLDGRTWDIQEIDSETGGKVEVAQGLDSEESKPRHFLVFGGEGLRVLRKQRPLDELLHLVRIEATTLKPFVDVYGQEQTCCWLLAIACGNTGYIHPSLSPRSERVNVHLTRRFFFQHGGTPMAHPSESFQSDLGMSISPTKFQPSAGYQGLDLYYKRVVAPIWKRPLLVAGGGVYVLGIPESMLTRAQTELQKLKSFIDDWPQISYIVAATGANSHGGPLSTSPLGGSDRATPAGFVSEEVVWNMERALLHQRFDEIKLTMEAVAFALILARMRLPEIMGRHAKQFSELAQTLLSQPFEHFISDPGRKFCGVLALRLVQHAVNAMYPTESLSPQLREHCPTLLHMDDIYTSTILEKLQSPFNGNINMESNAVVQDMCQNAYTPKFPVLEEALQIALQVAGKLRLDQYQAICQRFLAFGFVRGVLDLGLHRASEVDVSDDAAVYVIEKLGPEDSRASAYHARRECYAPILDAFNYLNSCVERFSATGISQSVESSRSQIHERALASTDKVWHFELYSWYAAQDPMKILDIRTPYIEQWLSVQPSVDKQELLAQYYVTHRKFSSAARTLFNLALSYAPENTLTLPERLDILQRALQTSKACSDTPLQTEIEDVLDVTRIQVQLIDQLRQRGELSISGELETGLILDMQSLFELAQEQNLQQMQFKIVAASSSDVDRAVMAQLWRDMLIDPDSDPGSCMELETRLAETFAIGGSLAPSQTPFPSQASMVGQAELAGSAIFASDVWVEVISNISFRHASYLPDFDHKWWLRTAARAAPCGLVDFEGIYFALEHNTRCAQRPEEKKFYTRDLVECLSLWHDQLMSRPPVASRDVRVWASALETTNMIANQVASNSDVIDRISELKQELDGLNSRASVSSYF